MWLPLTSKMPAEEVLAMPAVLPQPAPLQHSVRVARQARGSAAKEVAAA
jgi:hypothetical protein